MTVTNRHGYDAGYTDILTGLIRIVAREGYTCTSY
jgi:hypothetical protein